MLDDLDDLRIIVACEPDGAEILVADMATVARNLAPKRTAAAALGSLDPPPRLATISASSSLARFLPR